jgi:ribosomal protein S27AE
MTGNTFTMSERRAACPKCEFIPDDRLAKEKAEYLAEFRADVEAMTKAASFWLPHLQGMEPDLMTRKAEQECPKCGAFWLTIEFDTWGTERWMSGRCLNEKCRLTF